MMDLLVPKDWNSVAILIVTALVSLAVEWARKRLRESDGDDRGGGKDDDVAGS